MEEGFVQAIDYLVPGKNRYVIINSKEKGAGKIKTKNLNLNKGGIVKKFLIKFGLRRLKKALAKDAYKLAFVNAVNKRIDIPKLDESQEKKLFTSLYKSIVDALIDFVDNAL